MHTPDRDGQTFHLTSPEPIGLQGIYRGVAREAGLPPMRGMLPHSVATPVLKVRGRAKVVRNVAAAQLGIPPEMLDGADPPTTFDSDATQKALQG
jgi:thioester reductase-like protein